jgi:hypothetical protein
MQSQSRDTGTDSKQDRSDQPGRLGGGNYSLPAGADSGNHGQKRGTQIKQGGGGGELQGSTTGTNRSWGNNERERGGNSFASPSREKHDQPKNKGKHYIGGKLVGEAATDLMPVECDDRGLDASGNSSKSTREKSGQGKAQRLDMSTAHRFDSRT